MKIRALAPTDLHEYRRIRIQAVNEFPASFFFSEEEILALSDASLKEVLTPSDFNTIYGVFDGEKLIALAGLRREALRKTQHRATIWGVYVDSAYQGQKLGRRLFEFILNEVREGQQINTLNLSVHTNNLVAKALYQSFGFTTYGIQKNALRLHGEYLHEAHMELELYPDL
jgi:ribosomal protein S18 acetylase RimI-like enzyme